MLDLEQEIQEEFSILLQIVISIQGDREEKIMSFKQKLAMLTEKMNIIKVLNQLDKINKELAIHLLRHKAITFLKM
jgi:hypothetical protein